jgi:hypothetical protein
MLTNKYNSLVNIPTSFTKEEWELAVSVLDFLPHTVLVELCNKYEIKFEGGNNDTDDETLVFGLFNHLDKDQIMEMAFIYGDKQNHSHVWINRDKGGKVTGGGVTPPKKER